MLIKLYALPADVTAAASFAPGPIEGVTVLRKPIGAEHAAIARWVADRFGAAWASEVQVALAKRPVSVWIATRHAELLGFACYDATALGFFGPIGVADAARGQGLGAALLRVGLQDMRAAGYGYAIAGDVGAPEFFRRVAGAVDIPDSTPGLYAGRLPP
jgi:GNAT superfamily N-acetyltransferase